MRYLRTTGKKQPVVKANEKVENVNAQKPRAQCKRKRIEELMIQFYQHDKTLRMRKTPTKMPFLPLMEYQNSCEADSVAFPLLLIDPNVHAVDSATNVCSRRVKSIYWNKKVNYYRSQRLHPTKDYDKMIPREQVSRRCLHICQR